MRINERHSLLATGHGLLASCYGSFVHGNQPIDFYYLLKVFWPLAAGYGSRGLKILGMNRAFGNLGIYNWQLAATGQGQEDSSQGPAASCQ
jgi:hypothetical protein